MSQQELINLYHEKETVKENIHLAKRRANKDLRKEHRGLVIALDILMVCIILSNIGALVMTNALVIKKDPAKLDTVVELNPVTAEQYNLVAATDVAPVKVVYGIILGYYLHFIAWTLMICIYLYIRFYSVRRTNFYMGVAVIFFWGVALSLDFFNNLGIYLGKVLWG